VKAFLVLALIYAGLGDSALAAGKAVPAAPLAALSVDATQINADALLLAEGDNTYPIKPSEAALIAQKTVPDSKVLNVKLLPSGQYAVTLKSGGTVQKVMVDATTGATS
jgi:uncharacterized membrane protein YkoI